MEAVIKTRKLIAVVSPAGGVGKSTICKELGIIFGRTKINGTSLRTCIVDANIEFGSQHVLFGIASYPFDICDWIDDYRANREKYSAEELDQIYDWEKMQKFLVFNRERNVYLLPAPVRVSGYDMNTEEADMLFSTLLKFFDIVIVDTVNALHGTTEAAIRLATHTFFVINDDERCCYKMTAMRSDLLRMGMTEKDMTGFGIIYNKFHTRKREQYLQKYMIPDRFGFPLLITIPEYGDMMYYNNRKQAASSHPTPVREPLLALAQMVIPDVVVEKDNIITKLGWKINQ